MKNVTNTVCFNYQFKIVSKKAVYSFDSENMYLTLLINISLTCKFHFSVTHKNIHCGNSRGIAWPDVYVYVYVVIPVLPIEEVYF